MRNSSTYKFNILLTKHINLIDFNIFLGGGFKNLTLNNYYKVQNSYIEHNAENYVSKIINAY